MSDREVRELEIDVDGYRVKILIDGNTGPLVVLNSGLGGRAVHWIDTVANLARDHTVVRFDRPGVSHDRPSDPGARRSVAGEADRIAAVLDAVGRPDPAVLVGHSCGGLYVEGFARLYPQRTRALTFLDSSIAADDVGGFALPLGVKLAAADVVVMLLERLHLQAPLGRVALTLLHRRRPGGLDAQTRSELQRAAAEPGFPAGLLTEYAAYPQLTAELCALRTVRPLPPVRRMVVTAHTGWLSRRWLAQQKRMAKALGAEHEIISPAGHLVMIEQPQRTAELIREISR